MARSYQDVEPLWKYKEGEAFDIIELQVKEFRKDQLRVNYGTNGVLTVSGERPVEGNKWIRFRKEFNPPKDSKANEIRARLSSGTLYITIPKKPVQQQVTQHDQVKTGQQDMLPVEDKGKAKQDSSSQRRNDAAPLPTETAPLPTSAPKLSLISRLKMGRKTALKIVASVVVTALLFIVLFYLFKYYIPLVIVDV